MIFVDKFAASCQSKQKGRVMPNSALTSNQDLQIPGGNFCDNSAKSGHEIFKLANLTSRGPLCIYLFLSKFWPM